MSVAIGTIISPCAMLFPGGSGPPAPFNPLSIPGCELWLDSADASTLHDAVSGGGLTDLGGTVARMADKSVAGNDYVQSVLNNRPVRSGGGLVFDGINDYLVGALPFVGVSVTLVAVLSLSDHVGNHRCFAQMGALDSNDYGGASMAEVVEYTNSLLSVYSSAVVNSAPMPASGTTALYVMRLNGATNEILINGALAASVTSGSSFVWDEGYAGCGYLSGAPTGFSPMTLMERLIYSDSISDSDMSSLNAHLMSKWSISP